MPISQCSFWAAFGVISSTEIFGSERNKVLVRGISNKECWHPVNSLISAIAGLLNINYGVFNGSL